MGPSNWPFLMPLPQRGCFLQCDFLFFFQHPLVQIIIYDICFYFGCFFLILWVKIFWVPFMFSGLFIISFIAHLGILNCKLSACCDTYGCFLPKVGAPAFCLNVHFLSFWLDVFIWSFHAHLIVEIFERGGHYTKSHYFCWKVVIIE